VRTDYEALIAELRGIKNDGLHYKAADAVEALQAENEILRADISENRRALDDAINVANGNKSARDALQGRLDATTVEWGVQIRSLESSALVTYPERDREACQRFIQNQPLWYTHRLGEEFTIVQRDSVGPWTVVPEGEQS
jgi:hypothetical protein